MRSGRRFKTLEPVATDLCLQTANQPSWSATRAVVSLNSSFRQAHISDLTRHATFRLDVLTFFFAGLRPGHAFRIWTSVNGRLGRFSWSVLSWPRNPRADKGHDGMPGIISVERKRFIPIVRSGERVKMEKWWPGTLLKSRPNGLNFAENGKTLPESCPQSCPQCFWSGCE